VDYAQGIESVVQFLSEMLKEGFFAEAIELSEYALTEVEKKAMDYAGDGTVYGILESLEEIHHAACLQAKPDPEALAVGLFTWEIGGRYDTFCGAAESYTRTCWGRRGSQSIGGSPRRSGRKSSRGFYPDRLHTRPLFGNRPLNSRDVTSFTAGPPRSNASGTLWVRRIRYWRGGSMKISVEITGQQEQALAEAARRLNVPPDELAVTAARDLIAQPDPGSESAASRVLGKNGEES
jgi:hypothetical protein